MTTEERKRTLNNRPPPFPEDFGERLEGLKEMVGVSWGEFAERLGVTQRGLAKWRRGGPPSGAYLLGHHRAGPRASRRLRPDHVRRRRDGGGRRGSGLTANATGNGCP